MEWEEAKQSCNFRSPGLSLILKGALEHALHLRVSPSSGQRNWAPVLSPHTSQSVRMGSACMCVCGRVGAEGGGGRVAGDVKLSTLRHFWIFLPAGSMAPVSKAFLGNSQVWSVHINHTETEEWLHRSSTRDRKGNGHGDNTFHHNILTKMEIY